MRPKNRNKLRKRSTACHVMYVPNQTEYGVYGWNPTATNGDDEASFLSWLHFLTIPGRAN